MRRPSTDRTLHQDGCFAAYDSRNRVLVRAGKSTLSANRRHLLRLAKERRRSRRDSPFSARCRSWRLSWSYRPRGWLLEGPATLPDHSHGGSGPVASSGTARDGTSRRERPLRGLLFLVRRGARALRSSGATPRKAVGLRGGSGRRSHGPPSPYQIEESRFARDCLRRVMQRRSSAIPRDCRSPGEAVNTVAPEAPLLASQERPALIAPTIAFMSSPVASLLVLWREAVA